jgi:hypothetical protein
MRIIALICGILASKPQVPDKPIWYSQLDAAVAQLEALPSPWVDRAALESVLGVGRRRAQQILQPLICRTIGKSGLADREDVIRYLRALATGEPGAFEKQRRQRLHSLLSRPRVPVEAPVKVMNQELDDLPPGVHLAPGRIVLEGFSTPAEAKQKLLALIMAMGNDPDGFDARIAISSF